MPPIDPEAIAKIRFWLKETFVEWAQSAKRLFSRVPKKTFLLHHHIHLVVKEKSTQDHSHDSRSTLAQCCARIKAKTTPTNAAGKGACSMTKSSTQSKHSCCQPRLDWKPHVRVYFQIQAHKSFCAKDRFARKFDFNSRTVGRVDSRICIAEIVVSEENALKWSLLFIDALLLLIIQ